MPPSGLKKRRCQRRRRVGNLGKRALQGPQMDDRALPRLDLHLPVRDSHDASSRILAVAVKRPQVAGALGSDLGTYLDPSPDIALAWRRVQRELLVEDVPPLEPAGVGPRLCGNAQIDLS